MRKNAVDPLLGQAETLVAAADAAAGWFCDQTPSVLSAARTARLRSRSWRQAAVATARMRSGPAKRDGSDLSFSMREAVESTVAAVCEAVRLGAPPDDDLAAAAVALRRSARALQRAVSVTGDFRAAALVQAKGYGAEVERRRLASRARSHDSALFIESIKRSEIAGLLGSAAEAVQKACDALAGSLSE